LSQWVENYVFSNPWCRLKDLSKQINSNFGIQLGISSLSRFLKRKNLTHKKLRKMVTKPQNDPDKKKEFRKRMRQRGFSNILSFDEVGFQLEMYPLRGWSTKGSRCYYSSPRGGRLNLTGSFLIGSNGIISYSIMKGGMNVNRMLDFIRRLKYEDVNNKVLVMDNLRVHHNPEVKESLKKLGLEIEWIPPYSPDLNPVEGLFSCLKSRLRSRIIKSEEELRQCLADEINELNQSGFEGYFKHSFME
jgi:transposase